MEIWLVFRSSDGGNDSEQQTTQVERRTTSSEASDQEIDITVTGDKVTMGQLSAANLREKIQNWAPNATVNLTDDAAIKATYEDVLSILTEAGVTIKETTK